MSQASDVEALLLRFLESEGARLTGPVLTHTSCTPPRTACIGVSGGSAATLGAGPAATPWTSQKSMCSDSTQEAEAPPVLPPPSAAAHSSFAGSSTRVVAAATPAATPRKRRRSSPGRASSGSESSSSTGSLHAAGGAVPHSAENVEGDGDGDISRAVPSSSSSPSRPTPLSLSHPVVEFLASVQLQGYAAHFVDDEGLRTMPALVAAASTEAEVMRLLGPYASLQQQSELWRGLRRWEKEEARRTKAAAEERRRRQQLEAREQRQQQQQREKVARREAQAARKGAEPKRDSGGGGHQLSMTTFTQLLQQDEDCFSFPSLFDRSPVDVDVSSCDLHATSSTDLLSSSSEAKQQQQQQQRPPPPSHARSAPQSATSLSCVSLTTSATQLMRELSYRRTRSRQARQCRLPGQRACEGSGVGATQTVTIDVDAEEATVDESAEKQEAEEQQPSYREEVDQTLKEGAEQRHLNTPGASQQSSESHLSSLLCSLQGPHDTEDHGDGQAPESSAGVCDNAHHHYSHNGEEWGMDQAPPPSSLLPHEASHSGADTDLLERADVVVNALVASRHVSLGALSAHAALERLPTRPFLVPTRHPLRAAEETAEDDDVGPCAQAAWAESAALTTLSAAGPEPTPGNSTSLTDARTRLEDAIRAALQLYNAEVAAVAASACAGEESTQQDEVERGLWTGPVCAVLQPRQDTLESEVRSDSLVCWSPAPPHHSPTSSGSASSSVQQPLGSSSSLPPPATHERATALPDTSTTPSDPTAAAAAMAVDVVLSAPSSTDVSTRTTARPTAAPYECDAPSCEDAVSRTTNAFMAHVDLNAEVSEVASRSQSVAALTVCTQQLQQQHGLSVASWAEMDVAPLPNTAPMDRDDWLATRQPRRDACRWWTCEGAVAGEENAEECTLDGAGSHEPLWVEEEEAELGEERTDSAAAVAAATSGANSSSIAPPHSPAPPPQSQHRGPHSAGHGGASDQPSTSSGEEWWDSYGIDALHYTQNNMDALPTTSQSVVSGGGADGSPRGGGGGSSPGATPTHAAWSASMAARSPVPREVVEVTSSEEEEEEDGEGIEDVAVTREDTPPERSRSPPAARGALPQPPLSPNPNGSAHRANASVFSPSHGVDSRLQPSAWQRMSNEELRALCVEFGLAVRPTPTPTMPRASSLPPPLASQASVDGRTRRSPSPGMTPLEWSSFGLAGVTSDTTATNTLADATTRGASSRTCRALFDDVGETPASSHFTDSAVDIGQRSTDKRVVRMEREALLAALRLLHVRLRFRHDVAPFHLHRVEHVSGLPYKRLRAADLLDEAAVLTRDDLQQARVRYKAEEQAEVERCVLSALVAEAAESVETYAQRVATASAAAAVAQTAGDASSVHTSVLEGGSSSVSSPGSPLEWSNAVVLPGTAVSSCYEQLLLREPVCVEAVTAAVQRNFPHVAHTRVQQLLTLNEVIAAVVVVASPLRSPSPPPSAMSPRSAVPTTAAAAGAPLPPPTHDACSPSKDTTQALGPETLSQEAVRRANTRRYFAQRGYMTRGGTWGRGVGQRGRGRGGGRRY